MTGWQPDDPRADSPDRVDALVWALTDLMLDRTAAVSAAPAYFAGKAERDDHEGDPDRDHEGALIDSGGGMSQSTKRRTRTIPSGW